MYIPSSQEDRFHHQEDISYDFTSLSTLYQQYDMSKYTHSRGVGKRKNNRSVNFQYK